MSGYEINLRHFLPNQRAISQINHTVMNNSIWTTNSQSFSYFQNLKVCRTMFDFCVHALLRITPTNKNVSLCGYDYAGKADLSKAGAIKIQKKKSWGNQAFLILDII